MECCKKFYEWLCNAKAYLIILSLQFGSAGMYLITMDALNKGMSHYAFVVYRNIIATVALGPFAFFLERFLSSCFPIPNIKLLLDHFNHIFAFASCILQYLTFCIQKYMHVLLVP